MNTIHLLKYNRLKSMRVRMFSQIKSLSLAECSLEDKTYEDGAEVRVDCNIWLVHRKERFSACHLISIIMSMYCLMLIDQCYLIFFQYLRLWKLGLYCNILQGPGRRSL